MRHTDIVIVGGGLAGSTAAAMLGRAGISAVLVDPRDTYPPDLRCEKLDGPQVRILRRTGLADAVLAAATFDEEAWVARFGRLLDKRPSDQHGILYDGLVNTIRAAIPGNVPFLRGKVASVATSADRQTVAVSTGESISARLVVLANGLSVALRDTLGLRREIVSPCHSITIGFDMHPVGRTAFDFRALTYYPERTADRMAYLTLFPVGATMRANLIVYRGMDDPWLSRMRHAPEAALREIIPGLAAITGAFSVPGHVKIRPADLYVTKGHRQAGLVLVGDAFATSCPAAGTGAAKVFTDVERLCNEHIPRWLASEGMDVDKIVAFYDDPVKVACDRASTDKAYFLRSLSIDDDLIWRAHRHARFLAGLCAGRLRKMRREGGQRPHSARHRPELGYTPTSADA